jgi:peptidyl-dipeptidase Dcp
MWRILTVMTFISAFISIAGGVAGAAPEPGRDNPLLTEWNTPEGTPPFSRIELEYIEPAMIEAMARHAAEIAAITGNPEPPTFANTIEALDRAGALLSRVGSVFSTLNGTVTNDSLQAVARRLAPLRSQHQDAILLNAALFGRVDAVHRASGTPGLDQEQKRLVLETWREFKRGGADLKGEQRQRLQSINEELSLLSLQFGENVLKETNRYELVVEDEAGLSGLPAPLVQAAAETAERRGQPGRWIFTLQRPSLIPFLQYSSRRDLREKLYRAYLAMGSNGDELDNRKVLARVTELRLERARLLGFPSHAHYALDENMAATPDAVYALLRQLWTPALARAKGEVADMQAMIDAEGGRFQLAAWDWWYYAEKVKKARFDLDEEMLRPYFALESVRTGMFEVVRRLWGLTFSERTDIETWHPEVKVYDVRDADGSLLATWYSDYFPRESKRGGAWMSSLRKERLEGDRRVTPLIYNVGNFTRPAGDAPALLSADEVRTMYHEFGHALHGMLSQCRYEKLSGTSVTRDFVELPSQIMENWALEPQVLAMYARHWRTGESIPAELVERLQRSRHFNQGFETVEYLAASFLDMDWHTISDPGVFADLDVDGFEAASLGNLGLIDQVATRYRSPYFRHIFGGGYSAGYYAYVWAEVLDADAYAAFTATGDIFDAATALSFRRNILERGGSDEPMDLYRKFRGRDPGIEPLLVRRGLD